ncbi:MAG TPA: sensor histidine kinase [Nocardioidaceae bacterium]|nr:sensor histidine kinase [Nocardioidaceae bacterium]
MTRRRMTLAGQLLALQLVVVLVVLVVVGLISFVQSTRGVERDEGREASKAAENLASQPIVRASVEKADSGTSPGLAAAGEANRSVSGSAFVAIADKDGTVLASSDPALHGQPLPLGESDVLFGRRWTGTTVINGNELIVAHVPILFAGTKGRPAGEMIGIAVIGRDVPTRWERLEAAIPNLAAYLGVASAIGVLGSFLLSRRIKRQTLGLEPIEIAGLVEHREAMLHGIKEGVIALDTGERVTLVNDSALALLDLPADAVGRSLGDLGVEAQVRDVLTRTQPGPDRLVLVGDRVLAFNRMPMRSRGDVIGSVTTMRDRTELSSLEEELGTTRATTDTLRAQTHEFANQIHTISGLLELEEYDEVQRYVDGVRLSRTKLYDEVTARVQDATLAALLIAKASLAAERGVVLEVEPSSSLGKVHDQLGRDLTTVVGNLVDNALDAVGSTPGARVRVRLHEDDEQVEIEVRDSGEGVPPEAAELVFRQGWSTKSDVNGAGRGFGLALTRVVCRRRGGDVLVTNEGGARFVATLPKQGEERR